MPDWRNPDDYRFPPNFPVHRWAWEFLRRNPDYRKDWSTVLSRFRSKTGEFQEHKDWIERLRRGEHLVLTDEIGTDNPDDPLFNLPVEEAEKWGLRVLVNPFTDYPADLGFHPGGIMRVMREGESLKSRGPAYPIVVFDLQYQLKPQFEAFAPRLEHLRKSLGIKLKQPKPKHHRALWPRYLRLLDADLDGPTLRQINDVLKREEHGMHQRKVWDQLQAAKKMIQPDGYLSILLPSEKSGT
jgi:transcriptional regulator